jgi:hypothetical protein
MENSTPLRAVRLKCLDCMGGSAHEVRLCPIPDCPLYPWRTGHRPKRLEAPKGPQETISGHDAVREGKHTAGRRSATEPHSYPTFGGAE